MPSCGAETHLFFSHLAIDASDTSASRTWGPCRPASPIAPSEASYEGRNELEECLDNDGRSVASTVCITKRHKTSRFGLGGGAVPDVAIARFSCFGGDMTETAVIDLVVMV